MPGHDLLRHDVRPVTVTVTDISSVQLDLNREHIVAAGLQAHVAKFRDIGY